MRKRITLVTAAFLGMAIPALTGCFGNDLENGTEIPNELRGSLYTASGAPAPGIPVTLYPADYVPSLARVGADVRRETLTDASGLYVFKNVPDGIYNLVASTSGGSLALRDSIPVSGGGLHTLPSDTLHAAGRITGMLQLQPGHSPETVAVYVPGTDFAVRPGADGIFTLELPPGNHRIQVDPGRADYLALSFTVTVQVGKHDTLHAPVVPPYKGLPAVTGLRASMDSLGGITLRWDKATLAAGQAYAVFRFHRDSLGDSLNPYMVSRVLTDTIWVDAAYAESPGPAQFALSDTLPRELSYAVMVGDGDSVGPPDTLSLVTVPPLLWPRTRLPWAGLGYGFTAIRFATPAIGYGLENLNVFRTTNGGATWGSPRGTAGAFEAADFPSSSVGYVVASYPSAHIFKVDVATDAWTEVTPGPANLPLMEAIDFIDDQTGYLAGEGGAIMKTTDGGATWSFPATGTTRNLHAIQCWNGESCYAAGDSGLTLKTADGGETWSAHNTGIPGRITSLSVTSDRIAYAVAAPNFVLKTTNGGLTWNVKTLPAPMTGAEGVLFRDEHTGFAGGQNAVILKTTDGGETWSEEPKDGMSPNTVRDFHCRKDNVCFAAGGANLWRYVAP